MICFMYSLSCIYGLSLVHSFRVYRSLFVIISIVLILSLNTLKTHQYVGGLLACWKVMVVHQWFLFEFFLSWIAIYLSESFCISLASNEGVLVRENVYHENLYSTPGWSIKWLREWVGYGNWLWYEVMIHS